MKLTFSRRKHIPLIVYLGSEYYPWQVHHLFRTWAKWRQQLRLMRTGAKLRDLLAPAERLGLRFSTYREWMIWSEWETWLKYYKPSTRLTSDSLILDAGAGEGETLFFYYLLGFRRFRCVEPDLAAFAHLRENAAKLPIHCELSSRRFRPEDVAGVDFAKVDVEGGETELLKVPICHLPREIVLETHSQETAEALKQHLPGMTHLMELPEVRGIDLWHFLNLSMLEHESPSS